MAVVFEFNDVSVSENSVIRSVSIATNPDILSNFYTAFEATLAFDASLIDIEGWEIASSDPQAIKVTNPLTPDLASDLGFLRVSGLSLSGLSPGTAFLTLTYSHALGLDPSFSVSNVTIDETSSITTAIQTSYSAPNDSVVEESEEVVVDGPASLTVASVIDVDNGLNLYGLADGGAVLSNEMASAGETINADSAVVLKLLTTVPVNFDAIFAAGLSAIEMTTESERVVIELDFSDGTSSNLAFSRESGLLLDSQDVVDTPDGESGDGGQSDPQTPIVEVDGVNIGSGVIDPVGLEVLADEVSVYFIAPEDSVVVYRQRLDDAAAFEAVSSDSSMVAKFIGDSASRTVANVNTGSLELLVDTPAGVSLDILGLSGNSSTTRATTYLNGLVDSVLGDAPATASWANSIKTAVTKMTQGHRGENIDVKVITPTRTVAGTDEITIGAQSSRTDTAVVNLAVVDDLVTTTGFESLVAVADGRLKVSGSNAASMFGDSFSQEFIGGTGDDFLSGGGGSDVLTGGAGRDTFEVGFSGNTVISDLSAEDSLNFSLFGVGSVDQLMARFISVSPGQQGLLVQFDGFSVELVGYNSLDQFASDIQFG